MSTPYPDSDNFLAWAQSLSGMITRIRTSHGSVAQLLESPGWNDSKTALALTMISGLKKEITALHKEMKDHVQEKFG